MKICYAAVLMIACSTLWLTSLHAQKKKPEEKFRVSLQKRAPSSEEAGTHIIKQDIEEWLPSQTAIIISDMWDKHWCTGATSRVAEMAPRLNEVLTIARAKGMLIVHAPSDCMDYYKDYPQRKLAQKHYSKKYHALLGDGKLDTEKEAVWPIDQSDEGCEDGGDKPHRAWTKQIDALEIKEEDVISDSGAEVAGLFQKRGIKNVILTGVHTNMCVIGRTFGLRNIVRLGLNVALMRDMTDVMYNSKMWPYVSHFTGNSLMAAYIETYVCPTIVSTDFTGRKQFRFPADKRPILAFLTAEGEYRANQRLPEFAHHLLLKEGVQCEYAIGLPLMEGPGRHNLENLQIMEDADLAIIFIRRIALEPEKMAMIKNFVNKGKPVFGIRTASHAFDAKGNVPREGGGITAAKETVSGFLEQWPEFDKTVLGGNYQGHHAHLKELTQINIVPGMEKHPLLEGVTPAGFGSKNWLYKNAPLRSPNAQVLLTGSIPGEPAEPVLWINQNDKNKIIYTSLGHWDDWKIESVHHLFVNSVRFLLQDTGKK